jgi:hypothetical protein
LFLSFTINLWGHPHTSASPSSLSKRPFLLSNTPTVWLQLLLCCTNSLFLGRQQTALSPHHACHICQLTNGTAGWPAEIWIKESSPSSEHSFNAYIKKRQRQEENSHRNKQARRTARTNTSSQTHRLYTTTGNHCLFYERSNCHCIIKGVIVSATYQKGVTSFGTLTLQHEGVDLYSLRAASEPSACHGPPPAGALHCALADNQPAELLATPTQCCHLKKPSSRRRTVHSTPVSISITARPDFPFQSSPASQQDQTDVTKLNHD